AALNTEILTPPIGAPCALRAALRGKIAAGVRISPQVQTRTSRFFPIAEPLWCPWHREVLRFHSAFLLVTFLWQDKEK
ncbi:hypothetical protein, partial [Burkholderia multivorans]